MVEPGDTFEKHRFALMLVEQVRPEQVPGDSEEKSSRIVADLRRNLGADTHRAGVVAVGALVTSGSIWRRLAALDAADGTLDTGDRSTPGPLARFSDTATCDADPGLGEAVGIPT